ncbi:hypothetical protein PSHT_14456 [Puccinia striiformis]|uniref:Uncharacterized protein n=1 Tax=Puccinia striiformis TaxID=27350 RepID=A0A2S4UKE7_9BASI|nr:hypothetical protein PSHT_14456 [Puccinia striiformis]
MVRTSQRQQLIAALEKSIESELVAKALEPALECDEEGSSSASLDTDARNDREEDERWLFWTLSQSESPVVLSHEPHILLPAVQARPQRPVIEQMMVTLHRLGTFGNGVSVGMVGHQFRIADGSVELYTNRCLMAILRLQSKLVTWPNARARSDISQDFKEVGFDGCVGLIDGAWLDSLPAPRKMGQITIVVRDHMGLSRFLCVTKTKISPTFTLDGRDVLTISDSWQIAPSQHHQQITSQRGSTYWPIRAFLPMENVPLRIALASEESLPEPQRVALTDCKQTRYGACDRMDYVLHNYLNQGEDFEFEQEGSTADEAEVPLSATDNHPAGAASTAGTQKQLRVLMQAREF